MTKHFICLSNSQWETIKGLINWSPPPQRGVPRATFRKVWNSIFFHPNKRVPLDRRPKKS